MELFNIELYNYRCIEKVTIPIKTINGSKTFCLFGINESGKSSILKGISLFDSEEIIYPKDYYNDEEPVEVRFNYDVSQSDLKYLIGLLIKDNLFPKELANQLSVSRVSIVVKFSPDPKPIKTTIELIDFKTDIVKGYKIENDKAVKAPIAENEESTFSYSDYFSKHLTNHFWKFSHDVVLWEAQTKYLIVDEIDLNAFSAKPTEVSIPLTNCFKLAGIKEEIISKEIAKLLTPAPIRNLESLLSDSVTKHIKKVWQEHPISIKFEINNGKISLLIEDDGVKHNAKTTNQRSDGFRQFISFLLTISAENFNKELSNTIMLIDEPETHLHPQAQINLKEELIKITSNQNNNIVYYATHSNYMIDKKYLNRNIKVLKSKNEKTKIEAIIRLNSSYSEVNFTVFNVATNDYHNELYGYLEDVSQMKLDGLTKDRDWINEKTDKTEKVSLPKYIRNSIHHPENNSNRAFTEIQLRKSIKILRDLKYKKT